MKRAPQSTKEVRKTLVLFFASIRLHQNPNLTTSPKLKSSSLSTRVDWTRSGFLLEPFYSISKRGKG
jgi:hypothetical protein